MSKKGCGRIKIFRNLVLASIVITVFAILVISLFYKIFEEMAFSPTLSVENTTMFSDAESIITLVIGVGLSIFAGVLIGVIMLFVLFKKRY